MAIPCHRRQAPAGEGITAGPPGSGFLGTGEGGWCDGPGNQARLDEPDGLNTAHGWLYLADTNNHQIRVANLTTRQVTTLRLI